MRAYQIRNNNTIVANPKNTKTATLVDELLATVLDPDALELVGVTTVGVGLGVVMLAGALYKKVYEPVSGVSVALNNV